MIAERSLALSLVFAFAACSSSKPVRSDEAITAAPARAAGAALFRPNDVLAYVISDSSGKKLGRTHSTFLKSDDGTPQVVTRVELDGGEGVVQLEHATTFRTDLSPMIYKRLSSATGRYELKFGGEEIEVATDRTIRKIKASMVRSPIVPENDLMMLALAIDDQKLEPGASATMDVWAPESMDSEPWKILSYAAPGGGMTIEIPGGKATLDASGRITRLERAGYVFSAEIPAGKAPSIVYAPPLAYVKPDSARWEDRPFRVAVQGGELAGVISVPRDRGGWEKKLAPVVIFVSGRGDQDRFGFEGALDLGTWEIADALADRNFAVVRLDDRGVGESVSTIEAKDRSLGLWVGDLVAVLGALERVPDVDRNRVFLVGHGLGALPVILTAAKTDVAGLVLIGAPFRPLVAFRPREDAEKDREGVGAELRVKRVVAALDGDPQAIADMGVERLRMYRSEKHLLSDVMKLDLRDALSKVKVPVAVCQGLADFQASWKEDAQPLVEALAKSAGKDKVKLLAYDRTDHLMRMEAKRSSVARYADRSRRVEPRFLEDLGKWLENWASKPLAQ